MMLIRAFERILAKRADQGFQLLSTGEEAVAVGICSGLAAGDQLLCGGRAIGAAIARGVDTGQLAAELLGKTTGVNRGRAGRGHMSAPESGFFGAHAVVAGNISIAAGVALAKKLDADSSIAAVIFGDGAWGAGAVHETLNIAAVSKLPILFVCNNNQYSVSTPSREVLAPALLSAIGSVYGIESYTVDGMDVDAVAEASRDATQKIRSGAGPVLLECVSQRFHPHSSSARETRTTDELERMRTLCPIVRLQSKLLASDILSQAQIDILDQEAETAAIEAFRFADSSPAPSASEVLEYVE